MDNHLHTFAQQVIKPCSDVVMHHIYDFYLLKMKMQQQPKKLLQLVHFCNSKMSLEKKKKTKERFTAICFNNLENKISSVGVF